MYRNSWSVLTEQRRIFGWCASLLERQVVGQPIERVDMVDSVLGEASVAGETFRAVAFPEISII